LGTLPNTTLYHQNTPKKGLPKDRTEEPKQAGERGEFSTTALVGVSTKSEPSKTRSLAKRKTGECVIAWCKRRNVFRGCWDFFSHCGGEDCGEKKTHRSGWGFVGWICKSRLKGGGGCGKGGDIDKRGNLLGRVVENDYCCKGEDCRTKITGWKQKKKGVNWKNSSPPCLQNRRKKLVGGLERGGQEKWHSNKFWQREIDREGERGSL